MVDISKNDICEKLSQVFYFIQVSGPQIWKRGWTPSERSFVQCGGAIVTYDVVLDR